MTYKTILAIFLVGTFALGSIGAWWASAVGNYHECVARQVVRQDLVDTLIAARDESLRRGATADDPGIIFVDKFVAGLPFVECSKPLGFLPG